MILKKLLENDKEVFVPISLDEAITLHESMLVFTDEDSYDEYEERIDELEEEEEEAEEKYMLKSLKDEYGEDDGKRYYDMWRYKSGRFARMAEYAQRHQELNFAMDSVLCVND